MKNPQKKELRKNLLVAIEKVLSNNKVVLKNKGEKAIAKAVKQIAKETIYKKKVVKKEVIKDTGATA